MSNDTSKKGSDAGSDAGRDTYRDDPELLGQSSDVANRGSSSRTSGDSPGQSSDPGIARKGVQDWKVGPKSEAGGAVEEAADDDSGDEVKSRSADPGQSSYGGFKNEGPSDTASSTAKDEDR